MGFFSYQCSKSSQIHHIEKLFEYNEISDYTIRQKSEQGFPALSLKKLKFNDVTTELLWFLRGDNDIEFLRKHNVNIWNKDAYNWHVREREFKGIKQVNFFSGNENNKEPKLTPYLLLE